MTTSPTMTVFSQVSILARSDERAQYDRRAINEAMDEVQASPALKGGRIFGAPPFAPASQVPILSRSDERAQSGTRDADFLPLSVSILARSDERAQQAGRRYCARSSERARIETIFWLTIGDMSRNCARSSERARIETERRGDVD